MFKYNALCISQFELWIGAQPLQREGDGGGPAGRLDLLDLDEEELNDMKAEGSRLNAVHATERGMVWLSTICRSYAEQS